MLLNETDFGGLLNFLKLSFSFFKLGKILMVNLINYFNQFRMSFSSGCNFFLAKAEAAAQFEFADSKIWVYSCQLSARKLQEMSNDGHRVSASKMTTSREETQLSPAEAPVVPPPDRFSIV